MSTITSPNPALFSNQTYSLGGQSTQQGATGNSSTVQTLLAAINRVTNVPSPAPSSPGSDWLDLSPQAQSLLSGGAAAPATGGGFTLTPQQQNTVNNILAKYKDAPFTQATYDQIQQYLKAAGLGPDQLALQDDMRNFSPTNVFLDALNGQDSQPADPLQDGTEQSNADAYMQQIYSQWQQISTTAGAVDASGGASA